ncbi:MAG: hypothetical protein IPP73_12650 [Chitinophagaceae bacterium]|nr:hypothetical protein [Chitinophagaceae bacterium]
MPVIQPYQEQGVWTITSGAGAITDASSPTTTVTGVTAGQTTVLRWTITNGACSSQDEVSLTNDVAVTVAAAGTEIRHSAQTQRLSRW